MKIIELDVRLTVISVTEKDIRKILLKHPWLPHDYAKRMAEDLKRKNCRDPEAIKIYQREYGRLRRAEERGEASDVAGVVAGKYLKKKRANLTS